MSDNPESFTPDVDLKEVVSSYTKHWKWFALSTIIFLLLAFVFLRYATPKYLAQSKIQIVDDESAGGGIDLFKELDILSGGDKKVEDEIQIIRSRSNFIEVVKELKLNTKIMAQGNIISRELYDNPPITFNFISDDSITNKAKFEFFVILSSSTTFGYSAEEDSPVKPHSFGKEINTPIGDIIMTPNPDNFDRYKGEKIKVEITPVAIVAQDYMKKVVVSNPDDKSNIVNISLEDPSLRKGKDIIDALVRVYNRNAIRDKKIIADRTSEFISDRIQAISKNLSSADQSAQDLKTDKGITDLASEANVNLNVGAANQQELSNYRAQLNIASSMRDIVEEQSGYEIVPANIGLSDPTIAATTQRYNQLVLERNRLLKSSNEKNPVIQNLNQQLDGLKSSMKSSLSSTVNNLGLQVNTLSGQQAIINSKIYAAPKNERALRDITRKQQTTEQLYLFLLQKSEEAQIAVASTSPKSKIIDFAYGPSQFPTYPKRLLIYLGAFIVGLLIPFVIIYILDLLDNKIHSKTGLEKLTKDIPVLGEVPRLGKSDSKLVSKEDRSVLAESLRILRTNLDYLIKTKKSNEKKSNIVFVTSTVPGEGKTFISTNLSIILASTSKVLLVGADIRNPKLYTFFPSNKKDSKGIKPTRSKERGLTEYLYDHTLEVSDIMNTLQVKENKIDVIYSGRIPPNPAELLMTDRIGDLFKQVSEQYDYVIVDTAPLMVVTDTLLISKYADHLLYVTKAGVTEKRALDFPLRLKKDGKIKGLSFVVNYVKAYNLGYGGKYGYGYGQTQKKWWKFN